LGWNGAFKTIYTYFLTRFNEIENKVNLYNKDLGEYHCNRKKHYISNYIEANGFNVTYDSNVYILPNTINLSNLIPTLDRYRSSEIEDIIVIAMRVHWISNSLGNAQIYLISNGIKENRIKNRS
jgi:hypothetical protein